MALVTAAALLTTGALAACTAGSAPGPDPATASSTTTLPGTPLPAELPASAVTALAALPQESVAAPTPFRLAEGVVPPTNRWFSSLALAPDAEPVFPLPLSARVSSTELAIGLPDVSSTAAVITGPHVDRVVLTIPASTFVVGDWDELGVRIDHRDDDGATVVETRLTEGSPFVVVTARERVSLAPSVPFEPATDAEAVPAGFALATAVSGPRTYAMLTPDDAAAAATVTLEAGEVAVLWAVPDGGEPADLAEAASHPVTGTSVRGSLDVSSGVAATALDYATADGGPTAHVRLPHQGVDAGCDLGTYPSILGDLPVCAGSESTWAVPTQEASTTLDLGSLSEEERSEVTVALTDDLARTAPVLPGDSYFGTKALYRLAMLASLADELGEEELTAQAVGLLTTAIAPWVDPAGCDTGGERCFVYDPTWRGVVGLAPSFGSESFNDHHFHYGYLLYAAAVLGELDPTQVPAMAPTMDAIAADIASPATTQQVPVRRVYDPFRGHSWASGPSPFADGNNQESSSEAVTAWAGLELWGRASDRSDLALTGAWLLANEAAATRAYWLEPDLEAEGMDAFAHEIVAMNWGGKRDWATWFSPEPSAMAGIQLLPLSPSSGYLGQAEPAHIEAVVAEAFGGGVDLPEQVPQFADYLLAYRGLAGPEQAAAALEQARTLPDDAIDGAFSRSYLLAWLLAATHR